MFFSAECQKRSAGSGLPAERRKNKFYLEEASLLSEEVPLSEEAWLEAVLSEAASLEPVLSDAVPSEAVPSEAAPSEVVSSGPETVSSVFAASPVISPSGMEEVSPEEAPSEEAAPGVLLSEEAEEETLELTDEETEELTEPELLEVFLLFPHPANATARAAVSTIRMFFFMFFVCFPMGSISFLCVMIIRRTGIICQILISEITFLRLITVYRYFVISK